MANNDVLAKAIAEKSDSMNNQRLVATLSIGLATLGIMFSLLMFAAKPYDKEAIWEIIFISLGAAFLAELATVAIFNYLKNRDEKQLLQIKQLLNR